MSVSEAADEAGTTLLNGIVDGSVDFRGKPSVRSTSGGWRSSGFIIGKYLLVVQAFLNFPSHSHKRKYSGRCRSSGEVRLLGDSVKPDNLLHGAVTDVNGICCVKREPLARNGSVFAFDMGFYR